LALACGVALVSCCDEYMEGRYWRGAWRRQAYRLRVPVVAKLRCGRCGAVFTKRLRYCRLPYPDAVSFALRCPKCRRYIRLERQRLPWLDIPPGRWTARGADILEVDIQLGRIAEALTPEDVERFKHGTWVTDLIHLTEGELRELAERAAR